jgi:hypothetical protein
MLDKKVTAISFGPVGAQRFRTLEKAIQQQRGQIHPGLYQHWEWLAEQFGEE